jgi:hypothetical protein
VAERLHEVERLDDLTVNACHEMWQALKLAAEVIDDAAGSLPSRHDTSASFV